MNKNNAMTAHRFVLCYSENNMKLSYTNLISIKVGTFYKTQ